MIGFDMFGHIFFIHSIEKFVGNIQRGCLFEISSEQSYN